jgi:hypothetical protein
MWVRHLVQQHNKAITRHFIKAWLVQRLGFKDNALMHGVSRFEQMIEHARVHNLRLNQQVGRIFLEADGGILSGPQLYSFAARIFQRFGDGMRPLNQIITGRYSQNLIGRARWARARARCSPFGPCLAHFLVAAGKPMLGLGARR